MTARLIQKVVLALVALAIVPVGAWAAERPIDLVDFDVTRYAPGDPVTAPPTPGGPEYTQAGGHPNTNIYMQFCGPGVPIVNATNTSPVVITTGQPHGLIVGSTVFSPVRVIGVNGNLGANGAWGAGVRVISTTQFELLGSTGTGAYTNGGEAFLPSGTAVVNGRTVPTKLGCTPEQGDSFLKDFTLKLPPGFLGSPTSVPACPTHLWLAGSCPDNTQLGHAIADTVPGGILFLVSTSVFNLQTLGWEPARLGTEVVPGVPPGPLPNTVTLRTAPDPSELDEPNQQGADRYEGDEGDYGINSYQINIPKELGGNLGKVRAIDIVLCAYTPCREQIRNVAQSVVPLPDDPATTVVEPQPFFVNPTSCETDKVRLEARSYSTPGELQSLEVAGATGGTYTLTFGGQTTAPIPFNAADRDIESALQALPSIGAGNVVVGGVGPPGIYLVRFAGALRGVNVEQLTASSAGLTPSGTVDIVTTHTGGKDESFEDFLETDLPVTGCENVPFDLEVNVDPDDPSPGASDRQTISLDYPDYADDPIWQSQLKDIDTNLPPGMGLAPGGGVGLKECSYDQFGVSSTRSHKQLNNDPHRCPEGSHVGDIEVETPVLPAADRRQGVLRADRRARPSHRRQPVEALPAPGGPGRADQARRRRDPVAERSGAHGVPEQPGDAVHPLQAQDGHQASAPC